MIKSHNGGVITDGTYYTKSIIHKLVSHISGALNWLCVYSIWAIFPYLNLRDTTAFSVGQPCHLLEVLCMLLILDRSRLREYGGYLWNTNLKTIKKHPQVLIAMRFPTILQCLVIGLHSPRQICLAKSQWDVRLFLPPVLFVCLFLVGFVCQCLALQPLRLKSLTLHNQQKCALSLSPAVWLCAQPHVRKQASKEGLVSQAKASTWQYMTNSSIYCWEVQTCVSQHPSSAPLGKCGHRPGPRVQDSCKERNSSHKLLGCAQELLKYQCLYTGLFLSTPPELSVFFLRRTTASSQVTSALLAWWPVCTQHYSLCRLPSNQEGYFYFLEK